MPGSNHPTSRSEMACTKAEADRLAEIATSDLGEEPDHAAIGMTVPISSGCRSIPL